MKKPKPFNLILLGDPASGKGTQSARLAKKYRLFNFDMGHEVRMPAIRKKFDFAKTTGAGNLTPTGIAREILERKIRTAPHSQGILFNGHPKMVGEARLAAKLLKQHKRTDPLVLYMSLPADETLRRAMKRLVRKGGKLVKREDDTKRALVNRRKYYREQVSQTVKFFKNKYRFKQISGMGTIGQVAKRIDAAIKEIIK